MTDLVHLLRGDIVNLDDEDRLVLLEESAELLEVCGLVLAPHCFFLYEGRLFKGEVRVLWVVVNCEVVG